MDASTPLQRPFHRPVNPNTAFLVQADATLVGSMVFPFIPSLDKYQ